MTFKLNPNLLEDLNKVSNAVLSPHLIDDTFWGRKRCGVFWFKGAVISHGELSPGVLQERKDWCSEQAYEMTQQAGAVFDFMIHHSCGHVPDLEPKALVQIEKARQRYHQFTQGRTKIGTAKVVE